MMDIYCPRCREPWDIDHLHDVVSERYPSSPWFVEVKPKSAYSSYQREDGLWHDQKIYETYFDEVRRDFRKRGCVALGGSVKWCDEHASPKNAVAGAIMDLAGDDIDFAATMMEDAERWGLFD